MLTVTSVPWAWRSSEVGREAMRCGREDSNLQGPQGPPGPKPGAYSSSATSAGPQQRRKCPGNNRRARPPEILDLRCGGHERPARIRALAAQQGESRDQDDEGRSSRSCCSSPPACWSSSPSAAGPASRARASGSRPWSGPASTSSSRSSLSAGIAASCRLPRRLRSSSRSSPRSPLRHGSPATRPGLSGPALPEDFLGLLTIIVIPVQLLLITVAMVGFNQNWHVEEERPVGGVPLPGEGETDEPARARGGQPA